MQFRTEEADQSDQLLQLWPPPKVVRYLHSDELRVGDCRQSAKGILQVKFTSRP
jgi:hypothetical protein